MEHPIKMDDLGGKPTIFGNTHINILILPIRSWYQLLKGPTFRYAGGGGGGARGTRGRTTSVISPWPVAEAQGFLKIHNKC